ncbi:hypothetical protein U2F10_33265 [Leptothoe sp. EHU-05/26/07-4]
MLGISWLPLLWGWDKRFVTRHILGLRSQVNTLSYGVTSSKHFDVENLL